MRRKVSLLATLKRLNIAYVAPYISSILGLNIKEKGVMARKAKEENGRGMTTPSAVS